MLVKVDNDKTILPSRLYPPRIGFDGDYCEIKVRNTDLRDNPHIRCDINGVQYNLNNDRKMAYYLPTIDKYYAAELTLTPTKDELKSYTTTFNIFKNNENCKYYRYSGDNYESTDIYRYLGTEYRVVIPEKHNMVNTQSATLTEFPRVKSEIITITTPLYMSDFWIKEDRITQFTINGTLNAKDYQFTELPNLERVTGRTNRFSKHMFDGETKLSYVSLTGASLVDDYAFNDCTSLTEVNGLTSITRINTYGFTNCTSLINPRIDNCTIVGSYAFQNCKSLDMDPLTTAEIQTLGINSFYNTPLKTVVLNTSTLPVGCFDYSENPFQKVIFTKASTINGLDKWTLCNGTYTNGMLYDGGKKHQVYTELSEAAWENSPATNDKITLEYYTGYDTAGAFDGQALPKNSFVFKAEDPNVIGLHITIKRSYGKKVNEVYWLPHMTGVSGTSIALSHAVKRDGVKYFYVSGYQLYDMGLTNVMDRITVQAIDRNGLMENSYRYLQNGTEVPEYDPTSPISKVLYLGTVTGMVTYSIDGNWTRTGSFPAAPHYLYITGVDPNFTNLMGLLLFSRSSTSIVSPTTIYGLDGNLTQYFRLEDDPLIEKFTVNGKTIYKIDLDNYYSAEDLDYNTSSNFLLLYYEGFESNGWSINLANLLNGSTSNPAVQYIEYTLIFEAEGGSTNTNKLIYYGDTPITLPDCSRSGYTFLGWYDEDDNLIGMNGETYTPSRSMVVYAKWEEGEPAVPPEKLPDTVTATIQIVKALCNLGTSNTNVTIGSGGSSVTGTLSAGRLVLLQNPNLIVRAELYDSNGKFINYYDLSKEYTYSKEGYPNLLRYKISTMENVSSSHTLKVYYRDNPSFGEFTITLTSKTTYR